MVTLNCSTCNKEVFRTPSQIRSEKVFCCRSCAAKYNNSEYPKIVKEMFLCSGCKTPIDKRSKSGLCRKCLPKSTAAYKSSITYKEQSDEYKSRLKEAVTKNRRSKKEWAIAHHGGSCDRCGYNKSTWALALHHVDPTQKTIKFGSGDIVSWESLKEEVTSNSQLLCHNCHRELHLGEW